MRSVGAAICAAVLRIFLKSRRIASQLAGRAAAIVVACRALHKCLVGAAGPTRRLRTACATLPLCSMYDFCLTPIYAFLLAVGGLAGYFTKGSTASLGGWAGGEVRVGPVPSAGMFPVLPHFSFTKAWRPAWWDWFLVEVADIRPG